MDNKERRRRERERNKAVKKLIRDMKNEEISERYAPWRGPGAPTNHDIRAWGADDGLNAENIRILSDFLFYHPEIQRDHPEFYNDVVRSFLGSFETKRVTQDDLDKILEILNQREAESSGSATQSESSGLGSGSGSESETLSLTSGSSY